MIQGTCIIQVQIESVSCTLELDDISRKQHKCTFHAFVKRRAHEVAVMFNMTVTNSQKIKRTCVFDLGKDEK